MGSRRIKIKRQKIFIRHPYETPATVCPQCKVRLDGATSVRTADVPAENITGCPTICMECGCLMIFTNEHGSVRRMTEEDKQRIYRGDPMNEVLHQLTQMFQAHWSRKEKANYN